MHLKISQGLMWLEQRERWGEEMSVNGQAGSQDWDEEDRVSHGKTLRFDGKCKSESKSENLKE